MSCLFARRSYCQPLKSNLPYDHLSICTFIATAPSAPPSYSTLISSLIKSPASWRALFVYAASGSAFALLNALCAASLGAHDWHLFSPTKRHTTNLNEWVIYLMVGNFCVGAALAFKDLIQARWIVKWPPRVVSSRSTCSLTHTSSPQISLVLMPLPFLLY